MWIYSLGVTLKQTIPKAVAAPTPANRIARNNDEKPPQFQLHNHGNITNQASPVNVNGIMAANRDLVGGVCNNIGGVNYSTGTANTYGKYIAKYMYLLYIF